MTVSYQYDVASSTSGGLVKLLLRWRGSVWKMIYRELIVFSASYLILTVLYRFVLDEHNKRIFEKIVHFFSTFVELIPLSFILGFYVSFTGTRWWSQYRAIPWPDKIMNIIALYVSGADESSRMLRRTLIRYLNLSLVLVLRSISMAVKRRFPTKDHLIEAGFLTKAELEMFLSVPSVEFNTFWIPCTWFINLLREARQECRITDSNGLKLIMEEFNEFRSKCGLLWSYDWISIPLVYTQVVTLATYTFFVACVFGRQYVNSPDPVIQGKRPFDYYVPVFTVFEFLLYMGLLKVAEQLINPFGDDDEDFELNWIIDRHIKVSYLGVDTLSRDPPPLVRDCYFDETDMKLPYTEASVAYKKKTYRGSVAYMLVPSEQQGLVMPDRTEEQQEDDCDTWQKQGTNQHRPSICTIYGGKIRKSVSSSGSLEHIERESFGISSHTDEITQDSGHDKSPGITRYSRPDEVDGSLPDLKTKDSSGQTTLSNINCPDANVRFKIQRPSSVSTQKLSTVGNALLGVGPKTPHKHSRKFTLHKTSNPYQQEKLEFKQDASLKEARKGVRFVPEFPSSKKALSSSVLQLPTEEDSDVSLASSTPNLTYSDAQPDSKLVEGEPTQLSSIPGTEEYMVRYISLPNLRECENETSDKTCTGDLYKKFTKKTNIFNLEFCSSASRVLNDDTRFTVPSVPSESWTFDLSGVENNDNLESEKNPQQYSTQEHIRGPQDIVVTSERAKPLEPSTSSNRSSSKTLLKIVQELQCKPWSQ
ncbi:bestrophin homolog 15-like isoform X2 [Tachypleus tridentatus]|uniref:bestrophin homolog 15-like isoform X2 n=1 Tax=Tachypleus tridentatus TaxID=6853 RepID=UPI003FD40D05